MIDNELKHVIYGEPYKISDAFTVYNPFLEDISNFGEEEYWRLVSTVVSRPYDAMVKLDDMGLNYQKISEYIFFLMQAIHLEKSKTGILFGPDFDFQQCTIMSTNDSSENNENNVFLVDSSGKTVFDQMTYIRMVQYIRYIHFFSEKVEFDVGNEVSRKRLIDRMRRKQQREEKRKKPFESVLSGLISSIVNVPGSSYTYESTKKMHISQLYDAYVRYNRITSYNQTMGGVYAGTVSYKDLDRSLLEWSGSIHKND